MLKYFKLLSLLLFVTPVYADGLILPPSQVGVAQPGQIPASTTNTNACSTCIGYYLGNNGSSALTTLTPLTVATLSLPAGDWDIRAFATFTSAATTKFSQFTVAINTTTNSLSGVTRLGQNNVYNGSGLVIGGSAQTLEAGVVRVTPSTTTNYYCVVRASFDTDTATGGCTLEARRAH